MATEMLSITAPSFCDPSKYELSTLTRPAVSEPTDVLIKVHAASVNPIDVKKASGMFKFAISEQFPYKIGYDCAGVVEAVGDQVKNFKPGDEVYVRLPESSRGSWSEYAKCAEYYVAPKPKNLSFADAASLPLAAVTALQALQKYRGSLSGKTVFVPAGLSGTGSYALQLAKNVFNAGKVITTVSTSKIDKVPKLLGEGVVDEIIDYTENDPTKVIPARSVDFILDTTGQSMQFLSLMTPSTSTIISISTLPSGPQLQAGSVMQRPDKPKVPWYAYYALTLLDAISKYRAGRYGVNYQYMFLESNGKDLESLNKYVEEKKLLPIVGTRANLQDIEKVRETCGSVYTGKGGIGKTVLEVIRSE